MERDALRGRPSGKARVILAIRRGIDQGLTHLDTAEIYGDGEVEQLVGEAIQGRREGVILVSKIPPHKASRAGIAKACRASLRRLRTDHLDGYLLHWMGPHPFEETAAGMQALVEEGLIRWWGVSNFDETALDRMEALVAGGSPRDGRRTALACNQVLYHLQERSIEHAVLPWCRAHGVALVGYSPFGSGEFPAAGTSGGRTLQEVAARHGASPRQVALAFLTREPTLYTIPKASDPAHVDDNAGALGLALGEAEIAALEAAFPRGPHTGGVPLL